MLSRYSSPARIYYFIQAKYRAALKNFKTGRDLKHIVFFIADHFEPAGYDAERLKIYFDAYKKLAARHRDSYGNRPKHTWFYRDKDREVLNSLDELAKENLGEVELHLHHGSGTENPDAVTPEKLRDLIKSRLELLRGPQEPDKRRYGFIHGMWALDNSRRGRYCGVNNELGVLRDTGCFADFTFPAWGTMQPAKTDSIFYAKDDPRRPKSYNTGVDAEAGKKAPADLLIFEGPANSSLEILLGRKKLNSKAINSWIRSHISVVGRDDWIFVKTNIHSLGTRYKEGIFKEKIFDGIFSYLEEKFNDGKMYRLHYVTAREAYNIVRAAEDRKTGDPEQYKNYSIPSYYINAGASAHPGPDIAAGRANVAFLVDDLYSLCGLSRNLLENVKWIDKGKFNVFIYALDGSKITDDFKKLKGIPIKNIGFNKFNPASFLRIINLLKTDNIEILHCYPFVSDIIGPILAKIANVRRIISSVHSEAIIKKGFLLKFSLSLSDGIIAVSGHLREFLIEHHMARAGKIVTIHNGVDLELFKPEQGKFAGIEKSRASGSDIIIMTVAKFQREKGYEYLIGAAGKIKESSGRGFKFILIGDGPLEDKIKIMAKDAGLGEKILFLGYRNNIHRLLSACDIFLLPSISEGFAIPLIEAMAMEKPVVATAVGGMREIVRNGENGFLVGPADPEAISAALCRLADDECLRRKMGARGRQIAKENFDARDKVKELEKLYLKRH